VHWNAESVSRAGPRQSGPGRSEGARPGPGLASPSTVASRGARLWFGVLPLLLLAVGCVRNGSEAWEPPDLPPWEEAEGGPPRNLEEWGAEASSETSQQWSLEVVHRVRMRGTQFAPKERVVRQRMRLTSETDGGQDLLAARWKVLAAEVEVSPSQEGSEDLLVEGLEDQVLSPEDLRSDRRPPGPAREVALALRAVLPVPDLDRHVRSDAPWPLRREEVREVREHGEVTLVRDGTVSWAGAEETDEGPRWRLRAEWTIEGRASGSREGVDLHGQGRGRWRLDPRTGRPDQGEAMEAAAVRVSRRGHPRWLEMTWITEVRLQRQEDP